MGEFLLRFVKYFSDESQYNSKYAVKDYSALYETIKATIKNKTIFNDSIYVSCINTLHFEKITAEQCKIILSYLLDINPEISNLSAFKKTACYMWYEMYEKNKGTED